jgi:DNA-directed RNA polymerase subunit H (RpoH/RPB5)
MLPTSIGFGVWYYLTIRAFAGKKNANQEGEKKTESLYFYLPMEKASVETKDDVFVQFMQNAKLPTSVTANVQPNKDLTRTEHLRIYSQAYFHIVQDLERAGYDTALAKQKTEADIHSAIELELYGMMHETYEAMPSLLDFKVTPLHQRIVDPATPEQSPEPSSIIEWRENRLSFLHLQVDEDEEVPPSIYVHFACFPEKTVFKEKQLIAILNNLHESECITSRDIMVIVTHNEGNGTFQSRKMFLNYLNQVTKGKEGNQVIHFTLDELQIDLHNHWLVPPARILHRRRERDRKIALWAHVEQVEEELPEIDAEDIQIRRLFAIPGNIVEMLVCSEQELDSWKYFFVKHRELHY